MPCFNSYLLGISKFAMSHCHWCYTTFFLAFSSFMPLFPSLGAIAARYLNWATQVIMFINIWLLPPFFFWLGNKGSKKEREQLRCSKKKFKMLSWFSNEHLLSIILCGSIVLPQILCMLHYTRVHFFVRKKSQKKKKTHTTNFTRVLIIWQKNK